MFSVQPKMAVDYTPAVAQKICRIWNRGISDVATYLRWNRAVVTLATRGVGPGDPVYLAADESFIRAAAVQKCMKCSGGEIDGDPVEDFLAAVRERVVEPGGDRVQLERVQGMTRVKGSYADGVPLCAAFLAATVLAAFRMGDDLWAAPTAYFPRLCELLGVAPYAAENPRPRGLQIRPQSEAPEAELWQRWNQWLVASGWRPTAVLGRGGAWRYTNLPISQTLLRSADIAGLQKFFLRAYQAHRLGTAWPLEDVAEVLHNASKREPPAFNSHLRRGFQTPEDHERRAQLELAAYNVYLAMDWSQTVDETTTGGEMAATSRQKGAVRRLHAELVRHSDPFEGLSWGLAVFVRPASLARGATVTVGDERIVLRPSSDGRLCPVWPADGWHPGRHGEFEVSGDPKWQALRVPDRAFWILQPNPFEPGCHISGGRLQPGAEVLLAFDEEKLKETLQSWRALGQLDWRDTEDLGSGWCEIRGLIVPERPLTVMTNMGPDARALASALSPEDVSGKVGRLVLEGGLRAPGGGGGNGLRWLIGCPPRVGMEGGAGGRLRVSTFDALENSVLDEMSGEGVLHLLPADMPPGEYLIRGGSARGRLFSIVTYADLELGEIDLTLTETWALPTFSEKADLQ